MNYIEFTKDFRFWAAKKSRGEDGDPIESGSIRPQGKEQ